MSEDKTLAETKAERRFKNLWAYFVAGCALYVIYVFLPGYRHANGEPFSVFNTMQLLLKANEYGLFFWIFLQTCAFLAFGVLGIKHPRRWVFLAGSIVSSFYLLLMLFTAGSGTPRLTDILMFIAFVMVMTGYWAKPPVVKSEQDVL